MSLAYYDHIAQAVHAAHRQHPLADDEALATVICKTHPTTPFSHVLVWVKQYRPAQQQQQQLASPKAKAQHRSNTMPNTVSNTAPKPSKSNPRVYVKTTAMLRKQTTNCAVYQSRALGSTYIPMVNFPEGEDIPQAIDILITAASK